MVIEFLKGPKARICFGTTLCLLTANFMACTKVRQSQVESRKNATVNEISIVDDPEFPVTNEPPQDYTADDETDGTMGWQMTMAIDLKQQGVQP